ncbi:PREDICTED: 26S proteasome non-ATPase regulatory subunit 12-like [Priapulus caudatus]|uniref:26S proteasome non-ATPase regulatory subunit 12-like n=1 Tax=Priapulus caudatus TaxID=37621 RepID=A0ABM1EPH3_PRICU|nr:PREDICTED: 26S proteasome non-ATPase regulatory subunit 12-like [Priapulus caudatus]
MADEGRIQKMEVDYTTAVDEKIPECEKLAQDGKLTDALEILMSLEKQTRTASDMHSTSKVLIALVKVCFGQKAWTALNEHIVTLSKRKGQPKQAITKMVQEACTYVDQVEDMETKLKLIDTLITVTKGKIYVEIERARLTHKLAMIKEKEGNIADAATILQELQVETFGSMDKKEKVEFIMEQMRLGLARKDYIRTSIISKKVSTKFFDDATEDVQQLKLRYYKLMIELDLHDCSYLSVAKYYKAVYDTPCIQADDTNRNKALKCVILYLVLAPYDNEQSDMIHRIKEEKNLEKVPSYRDLLTCFTTPEVMRWSQLCEIYETPLKSGTADDPPTDVFQVDDEEGTKRWSDLKTRVVEHNIRTMSKYYTKIRLSRMAQLLDLSGQETEEFLSNLVTIGTVYAKMDRLAGVINFVKAKDADSILNDWSFKLNTLMQTVNNTCHLINKEEMVHKLSA